MSIRNKTNEDSSSFCFRIWCEQQLSSTYSLISNNRNKSLRVPLVWKSLYKNDYIKAPTFKIYTKYLHFSAVWAPRQSIVQGIELKKRKKIG